MMETKKIIESLRLCAGKLGCHRYIIGNSVENISFGNVLDKAAERLEELERTINDRSYEWISVEDKPFPGLGRDCSAMWYLRPGEPCYFVHCRGKMDDEITHWMRIEPPKPEGPTFKDKLLEAFPKADIAGIECCSVFPQLLSGERLCEREITCEECWNQPYFEEEGEMDA